MWQKNFEDGKQITVKGDIKRAKQDVDEVLVEAQWQHYVNQYEQYKSVIEAGEKIEGSRYLVRGAKLKCSCGSHWRRLNLRQCHGVYVSGKAMINEEDCVCMNGKEGNIASFGVCSSEGHPDKMPFWLKIAALTVAPGIGIPLNIWDERKKILLKSDDGNSNVRGYACTPCIISNWQDTHPTQRIARNYTEGIKLEDQIAAVTEDSFLVCAYGGLIEPITSGQEDEDELRLRRGGGGGRR